VNEEEGVDFKLVQGRGGVALGITVNLTFVVCPRNRIAFIYIHIYIYI
jgi:hypothetical protein